MGCARGMTQIAAYEAAGFEPNKGNAWTKYHQMKDRIDELQQEMFSKLIVDKRYIMGELFNTYQSAKEMRDNSNRNRSLHLMGLELGMFAERKDIRLGTKFEGWSQEKLIEHVQGLAQQLAIEDKSEDD